MTIAPTELKRLSHAIVQWAQALGFDGVGIVKPDVGAHAKHLEHWLTRGDHGTMGWMSRSQKMRANPKQVHQSAQSIIVCKINYLRANHPDSEELEDKATVARYAMGRDYHKVLRHKLKQLALKIESEVAPHHYRVVCDSAPVMERALAEMAGLGWIGKNTMLIEKTAGSWTLLGALLTDIPLEAHTAKSRNYCGSCDACLRGCPTGAFRGPYQLDSRKCISYLTIEHRGSIPEELRSKMGNRIFGCDECQRVCPWNHNYEATEEQDFQPRHNLDNSELCALFAWSAEEYEQKTRGMAIRRCGYEGWLRNIAVALGNAPSDVRIISALQSRSDDDSALVREHVAWALAQHKQSAAAVQP